MDINKTLNTCDTSFGRRSTATKADTSGKATIPPRHGNTHWRFLFVDSSKDTLLLALVAASFACVQDDVVSSTKVVTSAPICMEHATIIDEQRWQDTRCYFIFWCFEVCALAEKTAEIYINWEETALLTLLISMRKIHAKDLRFNKQSFLLHSNRPETITI